MENCTQVLDISDIGFDISDLGRVRVGTLIINGASHDIHRGENVIGRDELSDVVLRHISISSKHAIVEVEDWDTHLIYDCGSTNRTRLGTVLLKPNVRYNLQGGEDIMFADVKAQYIKLGKPKTEQNEDDNVSDAGSESLLNSAPEDLDADVKNMINILPTIKVQDNEADESFNETNSSDLNESSLIERNKNKRSYSKTQVVEESDDSTDDELDFIPPSQTVKEFAAKKQLAFKMKYNNDISEDIFSTDTTSINTQEQDLLFMTENPNSNKISNSLDLNTQNVFSSEIQIPTKQKSDIKADQSIFEAETQDCDLYDKKYSEISQKKLGDIYDANTEIITSVIDENVQMSDLVISNTSCNSVESLKKVIKAEYNEHENSIPEQGIVKILIPVKKLENTSFVDKSTENIYNVSKTTEMPNLSILDTSITNNSSVNVKNEPQDSYGKGREDDQNSNTDIEKDSSDITDILTQVNTSLSRSQRVITEDVESTSGMERKINVESDGSDIFNACTQVNISIQCTPTANLLRTIKKDLSIKKEISTKLELVDDENLLEETQLNLNLLENNIPGKKQKISRPSHTKEVSDPVDFESEETQVNLQLYSFISEPKTDADNENCSINNDQNPVDNISIQLPVDPEHGNTILKSLEPESNILSTKNSKTITKNHHVDESSNQSDHHDIDESSNQSDSLFASIPLEQLEQEDLQPVTPVHSLREKSNEGCESKVTSNQAISNDGFSKNHEVITMGDMDICSTVGDGTYVSACGSSRKTQSCLEIKKPTLQNVCKNVAVLDQKKVGTESLNHSLTFNEPCGSSTPFRTEERLVTNKKINANHFIPKTPSRGIDVCEVESPDLPCTEELAKIANITPERKKIFPATEPDKSLDNLPLALKRTPRARKLSRKVAESLEKEQVGVAMIPLYKLLTKDRNVANSVINNTAKGDNSSKIQDNPTCSKKANKRKSIGEHEHHTDKTENESLARDNNKSKSKLIISIERLSVNITDIINDKDYLTGPAKFDMQEQCPAKGAKNIKDVETSIEKHKENAKCDVPKPSPRKRTKNTHVDQFEIKENASKKAMKKVCTKSRNKSGVSNSSSDSLEVNKSAEKSIIKQKYFNDTEENETLEHGNKTNNMKDVEISVESHKEKAQCDVLKQNSSKKTKKIPEKLEIKGNTSNKVSKSVKEKSRDKSGVSNSSSDSLEVNKSAEKSIGKQKYFNGTEENETLEHKNRTKSNLNKSIKRLAVITNINSDKDKITILNKSAMEEQSPATGTSNRIDVEISVENHKEKAQCDVLKQNSSKKTKKIHVDKLEIKGNTSNKLNKTVKEKSRDKSGGSNSSSNCLKVNKAAEKSKPKDNNATNMNMTNANQELLSIGAEISKTNSVASPLPTNYDIISNISNESNSLPRKDLELHQELLYNQSSLKVQEEKNALVGKQQDNELSETKLESKCAMPQTKPLITKNISNTDEISNLRKSRRPRIDITMSDKVTSSISISPNKSRLLLEKNNEKIIDDDIKEYIVPVKRSKQHQQPFKCHNNKTKENQTNKDLENQVGGIQKNAVKLTPPNNSDIIHINNVMESKLHKKVYRTKDKDPTEEPSSKPSDNIASTTRTQTRKSSRRRNNVVETDNAIVYSEGKTNSDISSAHKKNIVRKNEKNFEESDEEKTCKSKSDGQDSTKDSNIYGNLNIVVDDKEKSTSSRNSTRSKVKPARFRDEKNTDGSHSSFSGKGPSASKRSRRQQDQTVIDSHLNSTLNYSKKDSELFKTPVPTEDRSKTRNNKSRSRSRSDSSQSSRTSDNSLLQSPRRLGVKGNKVLFTSGLVNPTWTSQVQKLGGSVEDCPLECTLLVADKVRRTVKFLCVLGQGKPIVSPDWISQSWKCTIFKDPLDHLLVDKEAEDKFKFSLSRTILASKAQPLLSGYHIHATPNVQPAPEDIKSIVECCGGKYVEKVPTKWAENSVILSHVNDKSLWRKFKVKGVTPPIVSTEMLLIGVLQHKIEIEPHRL